MAHIITLRSEGITLGQFLKVADIIPSGGFARMFLEENKVLVNGEPEARRGRKLYAGDTIVVRDEKYIVTLGSKET